MLATGICRTSMFRASTIAPESLLASDSYSRKRKTKTLKYDQNSENNVSRSSSLVSRSGRVRRRVQPATREKTPEPTDVKLNEVLSPTKLSKYWSEQPAGDDDGFPFHLIDQSRISYYLLMLCPPKLIQGVFRLSLRQARTNAECRGGG
jgi:hypothetical protein